MADKIDPAQVAYQMVKKWGYPWLPCPICNGIEGCDHSYPERALAHLSPKVENSEPYVVVYEYDSINNSVHREFSPITWNGMQPSRTVKLFRLPDD